MEFLPQQNKVNAGDKVKGQIRADGKHVIVIGGGDTGSDCVGTSNRHWRGERDAVRTDAAAAGRREQAADLALLAVQAAHQLLARGGCEREFRDRTKEFIGERASHGLKTVRSSGRTARCRMCRTASRR
jgi:glutamate synthase (NADPH/NADH) small chain